MSFYCCASPVQPFLEVSNPAHQHIAADGDDGNQNNSRHRIRETVMIVLNFGESLLHK